MASFPSSVKSFITKILGEVVQPPHVNDLQDEVMAMQADLITGLTRLRVRSAAVTLAQDSLTANGSRYVMETEGAAATDTLSTIVVGGSIGEGTILFLSLANPARTITVTSGVGNIQLSAGNYVMTGAGAALVLLCTGTGWIEVARPPVPAPVITPGLQQLTGDVTTPTGGSGVVAATLANSGVTAGTYGTTTVVPQFTVDAKGRVTAVANQAIAFPTPPTLTIPSVARLFLRNTAAQSIPNGANVALTMNTAEVNVGGWSWSANGTVTIPTAGVYAVSAQVGLVPTNNMGIRRLALWLNGTPFSTSGIPFPTGAGLDVNGNATLHVSGILQANAGTTLLSVVSNWGGATTTAINDPDLATRLSLARIGPL